jgi:hypothetical protein
MTSAKSREVRVLILDVFHCIGRSTAARQRRTEAEIKIRGGMPDLPRGAPLEGASGCEEGEGEAPRDLMSLDLLGGEVGHSADCSLEEANCRVRDLV